MNSINDLPLFAVVEFAIEDNGIKDLFHQRITDGYISATELCKSCKKQMGHYMEREETKAFFRELSSDIGIPISELVHVIKGGTPHLQGTWAHPQVAIHLGQWLSPKFAVAVSKWVLDWMSGKTRTQSKMPYHLERYVANLGKIPQGYFSMLNEMTQNLIAPLENQGYTLPENMIPDISEGRMFCDWLRKEKNIEPSEFPTYKHQYDDGRMVDARLYPNIILADFRKHFYEVWIQKRSLIYFQKKDIKALSYLQKVITLLENIKIEPYRLENKIVKMEQNNPTSAQFIKNIQADSVELKDTNFEKNIEKIALAKVKK